MIINVWNIHKSNFQSVCKVFCGEIAAQHYSVSAAVHSWRLVNSGRRPELGKTVSMKCEEAVAHWVCQK